LFIFLFELLFCQLNKGNLGKEREGKRGEEKKKNRGSEE